MKPGDLFADRLGAFGPCYHGAISGTSLALYNGATRTTTAAPTPAVRYVKFDGLPAAPTPSADDIAAGRQLFADALLPGGRYKNAGTPNVRGTRGWFYRADDGSVFRVWVTGASNPFVNASPFTASCRIRAQRVYAAINRPAGATNPEAEIQAATFSFAVTQTGRMLSHELQPSPNGKRAFLCGLTTLVADSMLDDAEATQDERWTGRRYLSVSDSWVPGSTFEIVVSGGSASTWPTATATPVAVDLTPSTGGPTGPHVFGAVWDVPPYDPSSTEARPAVCRYTRSQTADSIAWRFLGGGYNAANQLQVVRLRTTEVAATSTVSGEAEGTVTTYGADSEATSPGVEIRAVYPVTYEVMFNDVAVLTLTEETTVVNTRGSVWYSILDWFNGASGWEQEGAETHSERWIDGELWQINGSYPATTIERHHVARLSNSVVGIAGTAYDSNSTAPDRIVNAVSLSGQTSGARLVAPGQFNAGGVLFSPAALWGAFNPRTGEFAFELGESWL